MKKYYFVSLLSLITKNLSFLIVLGWLFIRADTPPIFRDSNATLERRVADLISRMTIEEKISQTMMASPGIPRLGIQSYDWWNEALHGVARNGVATVFPQAIGLAATWNPRLHEKIADVISTEARAKYKEAIAQNNGYPKRYQGLTIWSPNINIFRDPRWGRGQETYGEDPFLTGCMGMSFVRGLQGSDPYFLKTVATVKHYAVHSGPEKLRHQFNATVSDRDLRETYLPAFEACIREGGSASIMSAYNAVNGTPAPANELLLKKILRDEWGFKGAVVGDVDNVADMWREKGHLYSKTAAEASASAIRTGNDLCSGKTYEALREALKNGLVTEADIDKALSRLFTLRFRLGEFDPENHNPYSSIPVTANNTPENDQIALEAGRQSIVLLKNDGILPWDLKKLKTVAVIGPTGNDVSALLGNYCGFPSRKVTLADGIREKLEPLGIKVLVEQGSAIAAGFRVNGKPFPEGSLYTDTGKKQKGFTGEVFKEAKKLGVRQDAQIFLEWSEAQPIEGIPLKKAALKWSGVLVPPVSGPYLFGVVSRGKIKITLGGKDVIASWGNLGKDRAERHLNGTLPLEAGKTYDIRVEYEQTEEEGGMIQFGWIIPGEDDSLSKALTAAKKADHLVLCLGITPDLEGEEMSVSAEGFDHGDRVNIDLPGVQKELLKQIALLKKPTVVVLTTGSSLNLETSQANAILLSWYYGQRGAEALVETLIGKNNPGGRLPITFYRGVEDLPAFTDYSMANRTYRFYKGKPLYAFGHGLSYTSFTYGDLKSSESSVKQDGIIHLKIPITNSGKIAGDEVVQIYARSLNPSAERAQQWLVGFLRCRINPGESKQIEIPVKAQSLRRWDVNQNRYLVESGKYELIASAASDQPKSSTIIHISDLK